MDYRKVLIFGQPFNDRHGGGITLTNLFRGWPRDQIAVADTGHMMHYVTTDVCNTYYQLGTEEFKWSFPFNLIQKRYPSGVKVISNNQMSSSIRSKSGIRYFLVNNLFYPVLQWFGIYNCIIKFRLSTQFKYWLSEFQPDLLYIQITTRESLLFAICLVDYLKIPVAIHFMDDWPSTIGETGLFKKLWMKKIDKELKILLKKVNLFLSISDAMSLAYKKRYGKEFIAFHNPIDTIRFSGLAKKSFGSDNVVRILYLGRIGMANKESLILFAKVVSKWNSEHLSISFEIFTPDTDSPESKMIGKWKNIKISPSVKYEIVPHLMAECDLLLLPLDFTKIGLLYAQYSIPTKASEYMLSGTPILVFAPSSTAISKFCAENNCAYCLTSTDEEEIYQAINFIIRNENYRSKWTRNAEELARTLFDARIVRNKFQSLLVGLVERGSK